MLHENLTWFKHASFLYAGSVKIYFDPWEIDDSYGKADIILVSHAHYDHFSPETIEILSTPETLVVAPHDVAQKLQNIKTKPLRPGETFDIAGAIIQGVPAYNVNKPFHVKENNWLGYVVSVDEKRFYHAGDTDYIKEMKDIKTDIALLPIGGIYTMNVNEAVGAAQDIGARLSIPMHYGFIVGKEQDGKDFVAGLAEGKAEILVPRIPFER